MMLDFDLSPEIFANPDRSARNLVILREAFIRSGSKFSIDQFSVAIQQQLRSSPDAEMALVNLLRFNEASVSRASLFNDLIQYPITLELLIKIFGHSQYFSDILVREPGLFRWLTGSDVLARPLSREELRLECGRLRSTFTKPERRMEALKRVHRREMLRIGAQDLLGLADLAAATQQLSDLADILVDEVCAIAVSQVADRFGDLCRIPFAVVGLGKLGGQELNYSSDIDVMFVYESDGEFSPPGQEPVSNHEYFVRLSEAVVQNLSHVADGGSLYRVDTRLRPESGAGPLARSVQGYLTYYESRGELWERQMLIKARAIAGDVEFGERFIRSLSPFVYPRSHFIHPAEYISRIKGRIEAAIGDEANVKLMRGGIRDVEFIVQALQLLDAGSKQELRVRNTLRAIDVLRGAGLLSDQDAAVLRDGYIFFRTLEHRLQTVFNTKTHVLPDDRASRQSLARRMGLPDESSLLRESGSKSGAVREVFTRLLSVPGESEVSAGSEEQGILAVVDGGLPEPSVQAVLARYGFRDVRLAARHLQTLLNGSSLTEMRDHDTHNREAFRAIAHPLFAAIARTPVPEMTLGNVATIVAAQTFPEEFYLLLAQDGFRDALLNICAMSSRLASGLAHDHLFLESLSTNLTALLPGGSPGMGPASDLLSLKQQQELRAGVRHLLGLSDFATMTRELTHIADFVISTILSEEVRGAGLQNAPLAIFALGKFGTAELTFDADIDLLFVGEAKGTELCASLEGVAGGMLARLTMVTETGRLYDIDARLRPEGRNAPLVVDMAAYETYLHTRASLWERQSLTRLRFVAGDRTLGDRVVRQVEDFVYDSPLPATWISDTVTMRRRTESRSRFGGEHFIDFKLGAGGMVDIEFLAQMIQLHTRRQNLRHLMVPEILSSPDLPFSDAGERQDLVDAYLTYRRAEMLVRIMLELRVSVLPGGESLERLARCMGFADGSVMSQTFRDTSRRVRSVFLRISDRLASDRRMKHE